MKLFQYVLSFNLIQHSLEDDKLNIFNVSYVNYVYTCSYRWYLRVKSYNKIKVNQLKYAQQHLANERTFLAWIRTAIAIVGIGFLATELHFSIGKKSSEFADLLAILLGGTTVLLGITLITFSTINFIKSKKQIEKLEFYPKHYLVLLVSILLTVISIISIFYLLLNDRVI